jgi:hypothetical protein
MSFSDEGARLLAVQQATAMLRADGADDLACDVLPFPTLALPEPPRAA